MGHSNSSKSSTALVMVTSMLPFVNFFAHMSGSLCGTLIGLPLVIRPRYTRLGMIKRTRKRQMALACFGLSSAVVLLVVQGGPGTLKMLLESARRGSSILIVSESGGAATAVFEYVRRGGDKAELDPKFEARKAELAESA